MTENAGSGPIDIAELFAERGQFVGRVIRGLTGDGAHVDDLVQETFLVAFRKQSEFRGDASPKTWLYGIAARLCLHHHRGSGRLRGFLGRLVREPVEHSEDRPDHAAERKEEISTVHRILEMLPFKQREVFVLYELERLDGEVIAAMIGIPIGTVWTRLHHGRKTFTRLMRRERLKEGGT